MTVVSTEKAPKAIGPYSQAIVSGDLVFASGQIPLDPKSGQLVSDKVAEQTKRVLDNLTAVLQAAGMNFSNIVKTTVIMTNLGDYQTMNEIYAGYFNDAPPARSTFRRSTATSSPACSERRKRTGARASRKRWSSSRTA